MKGKPLHMLDILSFHKYYLGALILITPSPPFVDLSEKHRLEMELQEAKAGLQDLVDELLSTEDELASKKLLVYNI